MGLQGDFVMEEFAADLIEEKIREEKGSRESWSSAYEALRQAEVGLSPAEKAKVFREAPNPQVVEDWIQQFTAEYASRKPKIVGKPDVPRV
jgi:hypothetical protein